MPQVRYCNSFVKSTKVCNASEQFGVLLTEYQVNEYWDLRSETPVRAYVVSMKQRVTINSKFSIEKTPISSYAGYPALVVQKVVPTTAVPGMEFYIEDYSPKTLNASVNTNQNQANDISKGTSAQHTVGSSTSVTNSYEVSASAGFWGLDPTGDVTAGFSSSTTNTNETSDSTGQSQQKGFQASTGSSMSIKDWASYAYLDCDKQQPAWVWGQEFPWNVIDFHSVRSGSGEKYIDLPASVRNALFDRTFLYPPSHIALFGLNFVAHAKWVFYPSGNPSSDDELVRFKHRLSLWTGSHFLEGTELRVSLDNVLKDHPDKPPVDEVELNLPVLALDPITETGPNGAVTGFVQSEFIMPPGEGANFRLKSGVNNLYIKGTGFDKLSNDDTVLTASNISTKPASLTLQFKVIDPDLELSLHLKHWNTTTSACMLTLSVNGQKITRYVDAMNATSGTDNITRITLRNFDYTSPEFYDYLVMGLNTVTLEIAPAETCQTCGYALRALAVQ
jgi:hypothetical protein